MKTVKTISEIVNKTCSLISLLIDRVFCFMFDIDKSNQLQSIYCRANYRMTMGGAIIRITE